MAELTEIGDGIVVQRPLQCHYLAEVGITRAAIQTDPANRPSIEVARRAGFDLVDEIVTRDGDKRILYQRTLGLDE